MSGASDGPKESLNRVVLAPELQAIKFGECVLVACLRGIDTCDRRFIPSGGAAPACRRAPLCLRRRHLPAGRIDGLGTADFA